MSNAGSRGHEEEGLLCGISAHLLTLAYICGIPLSMSQRYHAVVMNMAGLAATLSKTDHN